KQQPRALGAVRLTRHTPHPCQLVLYRGKAQGRHRLTCQSKRARSHHSEKHARAQREPWLLATNLPTTRALAKKVVRLYRTRMQIEEAFRDLKSRRFGLGLELHRTQDAARLAVLLLIGALALLWLWLIGTAAQARGLQRHYQANTVHCKQVLSVIYLGLRICKRGRDLFDMTELDAAWRHIAHLNTECWGQAG
ncbi:MAG: IS4 family transposase, partial [Burkholderiales bacterium]